MHLWVSINRMVGNKEQVAVHVCGSSTTRWEIGERWQRVSGISINLKEGKRLSLWVNINHAMTNRREVAM